MERREQGDLQDATLPRALYVTVLCYNICYVFCRWVSISREVWARSVGDALCKGGLLSQTCATCREYDATNVPATGKLCMCASEVESKRRQIRLVL